MISNICIYNNKLLIPIQESFFVFIAAYSYQQHEKRILNEKFTEHSRLKLPVVCSNLRDISLKVVENFETGLKCCLILIFENERLQEVFLHSDASRNKLVRVSLPRDIHGTSVHHLFVNHGPIILSNDLGKMCVYSLNTQTFVYIDDYPHILKSNFKIVQFSCIGSIANLYVYVIVYVNSRDVRILSIFFNQDSKEFEFKYLPTSIFIPEQYLSSVKGFSILKSTIIFGKQTSSLAGLTCTENVAAVFTSDECLIFENSLLKRCCKIKTQFPDMMKVDSDLVRSCSEETLVVRTENGQGCLIALGENNCKVSKHWDGIKISALGHLMLNGSKQVILLNDTDLKNWQHSYKMIDVFSFIDFGDLSQNSMPDECLRTTLSGIQDKIQAGKSAIVETTNEISQKYAATVDALTRLLDFESKPENVEKSKSFRESLVDLILSKDENRYQDIQPIELSVKIISEQTKFTDDDCFLSFKFMNESSRSICHPSMVLFVKTKQVQSVQKIFFHTTDSDMLIKETCSEVDPNVMFTISMKISLSSVLDEEIHFILTWYNASAAEFANEILASREEKKIRQSQMSFQRTIRCNDLLQMKSIKDIFTLDDLYFVLLSQTKMTLLVSSLYSDLSSLKNSLLPRDPSLLELEGSHHMVFSKVGSHLFGVNFTIIYMKEKEAALEVFTNNHKETLIFVHVLYHHLPDDAIISPLLYTKENIRNRKRDIICGIKDEVDLLLSSMKIHNVSDELRKNYSKLMSSKSVGNLAIPKDTYQRIRRILVKKEFFTDTALKNMV